MKVMIVGATGQLGAAVRRTAPPDADVAACGRDTLDITDAAQVNREIRARSPDLVVNAAAYTRVDQAESEPATAGRVNADGPRFLAESARRVGARLIQVSTDFVFSGDDPVPYGVDSAPAPLSVYGRSKLAGERAVVETLGPRATVVRTSWLYAREGRNFVTTMLAVMKARDSVGVVFDQVGSPTWVVSLAHAIWAIARNQAVQGIQHWSDAGVASWYDFAVAIQDEALARGLLDRRVPVRPIRTSEYPTPARRPRYSVLDTGVTAALLGYHPPHWRASLRAMFDEPAAA